MLLAAHALLALFLVDAPQSDWPPIPDFKTKIDYIAWYEKTVRGSDAADRDAVSLYEAMFPSADAKGRMEQRLGFTGFRSAPGANAATKPAPWKPADHTDWEKAFDATRELRKKFA